ncbi:Na+/H+ antiporter [Vagococcus xieshaowenii]|uniref:Na+/H+ antiporter n=1 Tax=Vagococcus xieshaowenii TaxID=2562451 RepID=A0AAJ5JR17_9ENTE|nr:Na+/H+ antiporter [Vagococcus xieshaowenii]QCA28837.1 Na+/H+ antiporter [Vagococcus xieshaowenii]TFZ43456.1 Na+/H+ antiporter [Vagococcus xieshaowenii]
MLLLEATILIILLVVISNVISHYLVSIPTALIEIAIGLLVVLFFNINITWESDWFMLLFVAPLLFNDAKHFPNKDMWELRIPIFGYAILLVFLTTILGGYFIHWLIPSFPLPLAMALIAVLSPTDPVAVQSIAEQVKLPKKIMGLISGESLINDASGLIAFKYALVAFMTGYFSIVEAATNFLYMAIVGGILGFILMIIIHFLKFRLFKEGIQDVILHSTIQLLTPFIIYMIAEEFHASGVIAVVTAGFTNMTRKNIDMNFYPEVRLLTSRMWDVLIYILNGIVFVLLGAELPIAMKDVIRNPEIKNTQLLMYILITWLFLLVVRTVWSYLFVMVTYRKSEKSEKPNLLTSFLTGMTGVRGAVTLATIMSMPIVLDNGEVFEQRSLMIAIACGVVMMSLIVASIGLPLLTKDHSKLLSSSDDLSDDRMLDKNEDIEDMYTEMEARQLMNIQVIKSLNEFNVGEDKLITADLLHEFQMRLDHLHKESLDEQTSEKYHEIEKKIQKVAFTGEKDALNKIAVTTDSEKEFVKRQLKNIRLKEKALDNSLTSNIIKSMYIFKVSLIKWLTSFIHSSRPKDKNIEETMFYQTQVTSTNGAISQLKQYAKQVDPSTKVGQFELQIINQKEHEYKYKLQRIKHGNERHADNYNEKLAEYYNLAIYTERKVIHDLYSSGKITLTTANKLRQSLTYYESTLV